MLDQFKGQYVLATCHTYFVGADSREHQAVWGKLHDTGRSNFIMTPGNQGPDLIRIGNMILPGREIKSILLCSKMPHEDVTSWNIEPGSVHATPYEQPHKIYNAEEF